VNKQAQTAVLFLTGAALLHAGTTDLYLRYVKSGLRPLLLLAGVALLLTALATTWYEWRASRRPGGSITGTAGSHREPRISWLLLLPLFALILVAPPALGSYTAVRTGTALQQPYGYTKLPERGVLRLSLVDYAGRAAYDHGRHLTDRTIKITGFVSLNAKGTPYLVRMALNCCAADAQPVKVALTGKIPPVLQPDTWLEATGTYTPRRTTDPINRAPVPYLKVESAKPVPTPHDPYDESWNQ
jgi:uncharacterized repeat protein (TIGR03943 family)